jgi:outer membrane protein assembly factor BamD (BamD/ComL family)
MLKQRRAADAVAQLEHLILTWPRSALVPQARRRLDEARGAVPRT